MCPRSLGVSEEAAGSSEKSGRAKIKDAEEGGLGFEVEGVDDLGSFDL